MRARCKENMEKDDLPLYPSISHPQVKVIQKDNMNPQQQQPFFLGPSQQRMLSVVFDVMLKLVLLGPENTATVCPFCHASVKTAVKYTNTTRTHIAAAICCLSCCCCLPYSMDSAKNADHYCPNCQRYLGTYHR